MTRHRRNQTSCEVPRPDRRRPGASQSIRAYPPDGASNTITRNPATTPWPLPASSWNPGVRSYISELDRGRRNWKDNPAARDAVYRNRRRIRGARGKRLLRQRGERLERPFAHLYETGRLRRVHLRGHRNILKRVLLHAAALNLGLLMRTLVGVGTPRTLQGRVAAVLNTLWSLIRLPETLSEVIMTLFRPSTSSTDLFAHREDRGIGFAAATPFTTGC